MVRKHKLLITGAKGTLAGYAHSVLSQYDLLFTDKNTLDITNPVLVNKYFSGNKPDIVLHLAAKTDVDLCQKQPESAFLANGTGTKIIATACNKYKARLCYISTAAVFDGSKHSYLESDKTNPVNEYAKSKLQGEDFIRSICENYIIVRIPWLIGGGLKEKKFISYIIKQIQAGSNINVVNDTYGNLAYAPRVLEFIKSLLMEHRTGLYHFGSNSKCSRFEIAKKIVQLIGKKISIEPVSSDFFQSDFSAPRPNHEVIYSEKESLLFTWQDMLESYYHSELKVLI